jgi:hypothetical protein
MTWLFDISRFWDIDLVCNVYHYVLISRYLLCGYLLCGYLLCGYLQSSVWLLAIFRVATCYAEKLFMKRDLKFLNVTNIFIPSLSSIHMFIIYTAGTLWYHILVLFFSLFFFSNIFWNSSIKYRSRNFNNITMFKRLESDVCHLQSFSHSNTNSSF